MNDFGAKLLLAPINNLYKMPLIRQVIFQFNLIMAPIHLRDFTSILVKHGNKKFVMEM